MQIGAKFWILSLMLLGIATGCGQRQAHTTLRQANDSRNKESLLPVVNPPYPGNYKTVSIDDKEMRQGRFPPGIFGGTLVRSIIASDPKVFNWWTASDTVSRELAGLMFRGLVDTDAYTGDVIPDMAVEVLIKPDKRTYITRLRKGLKWSDGKPITAHDVAFTWNTIVGQGYGNTSLRDVTAIDGKTPVVTVVDDLTNKFVTPKPFVPFNRFLGIPIAPKHVIEPITSSKDGRKAFERLWSQNIDPRSLVTSGPFVLSRFVPSQRVEFVRTQNFYMVNQAGKQLPYLNKIVYQFVPDVNTNLLKFKAKEIDISQLRSRDTVELLRYQEEGNYKLYNLGQAEGTIFVMFNMNRRKDPKTRKPYVDPVKSAWFNDLNFRQAVSHALNRDNMVANYYRGVGFTLFTAESPVGPFYNASLKPFPQNLNYSMSLLTESGFQKKADGFLYDSTGHKVEFDLIAAAGGTFSQAVGGMIVDDLKKLGMKVNFQLLEFNSLINKVDQALNWQAVLYGLSGDPLEPHGGANVFRSNGRLHIFDQRSPDEAGKILVTDARPWEKRLDEIFDEGPTIFDKTARKKLYDEYQKIVYDEVPFIYLVNAKVIVGARNTIGNYQPTPLSQSFVGLHNLEEIYKKQETTVR